MLHATRVVVGLNFEQSRLTQVRARRFDRTAQLPSETPQRSERDATPWPRVLSWAHSSSRRTEFRPPAPALRRLARTAGRVSPSRPTGALAARERDARS